MLRALLIILALACFTEGQIQPTQFNLTADEVINIYKRNIDFCKQHLTTVMVTKIYNVDSLIIRLHMPSLNVQTASIKIKYLTLYVHAEKMPFTHRNHRYTWIISNQMQYEYVTILAENMDTRSAVWDYTLDYLRIQIPFKARYMEIAEDCNSRLDETVITVPRNTTNGSAGDGEPDQEAYNTGSK